MPLTRFFKCSEDMHRYSLQLGHGIQEVGCEHCSLTDQWVSHGFVYKKGYGGERITVGKRVLCSNRGAKQGCGRTLRLYLAQRIPALHYSIVTVFAFMQSLLTMPIQRAYQSATGCRCARNAYRWLRKLFHQAPCHRTHILKYAQQHRQEHRSVVVETCFSLIACFGCGENYQCHIQEPFLLVGC